MATKTWQVNTLQRELSDGYVNKVIYRADLTESTVLGWVKAKLNEEKDADGKTIDKVAAIEAAVENGVNEQKTPTTGVGKPWS